MCVNIKSSIAEVGYWADMQQPSIAFVVQRINKLHANNFSILDKLRATNPCVLQTRDHVMNKELFNDASVKYLVLLAMDSLKLMGMPVMSGARGFLQQKDEPYEMLIVLPALDANDPAPQIAMSWAAHVINTLNTKQELPNHDDFKRFADLCTKVKMSSPAGINTPLFLQAAHEHNIPWRRLAGNIYQFGWGCYSRLLDSSLTDCTPSIGVSLARDKLAAAQTLRAAGVPVPSHIEVRSEKDALIAANKLGWPLVVKPADKDGGQGVFVNLIDENELRAAYVNAEKISKRILIERSITGNDYRLQVYQGKVYWVVLRRPARVFGDGVHSIACLIDMVNKERAQKRGATGERTIQEEMFEQGRAPIVIDTDLRRWLEKQNLTINCVPRQGQVVQLRGAANVSMGGTREGVPLNQVHPDNLELALRAVSVLRLDFAGIDLLMPDITRSWLDTGAIVCEVNGKPQLSRHLHSQILPWIVTQQGRIRVAIIVGLPMHTKVKSIASEILNESDLRMIWSHTKENCHYALNDPNINVLVWQVDELPDQFEAWPVDRFDLLVTCEAHTNNIGNLIPNSCWPTATERSKSHWKIDLQENAKVELWAAELGRRIVKICNEPTT